MEQLSLRNIANAVGAQALGEDVGISQVCTDSRHITPGCLFVALAGENFDGHGFVAQALEQGAVAAVVSTVPENLPPDKLLQVAETRQALLDIAGLYRRSLDVKVVGITGSVGKTTTKEMVACVCEAGFSTLKTHQNLNNEVGLSQMLLQLEDTHRVAVLEMGMDGPGQIRPMSRAAAPDIGVITNIGVSHLEALGSRENIRDAKLELVEGMPDGGTLILNGDDGMLAKARIPRLLQMSYGIDNGHCAVKGLRIKEYSTHTTFEISYNESRYDAQIPCMGRHNVYNALAAFCVGIQLGMEPCIIISALRNYRPAGMRQNVVVHNSFTVVEDCYNASPDSMQAALRTLGNLQCDGKRVAILSDMLELGALEHDAHVEAGTFAAGCGIDLLLCTGGLSRLTVEAAQKAGMKQAYWFGTKEELLAQLKAVVSSGDVLWVKASRGMKLEELVEKIYKEL